MFSLSPYHTPLAVSQESGKYFNFFAATQTIDGVDGCFHIQFASIEQFISVLKQEDRVFFKITATQPTAIDAKGFRRIARRNHVRRYVFKTNRPNPGNTVRADITKLVNQGKSTENSVVMHIYVAGQAGAIGEYSLIRHVAIMRYVYIGHNKVIVANGRNAAVLRRTPVQRHILTDGVPITDTELALTFSQGFILWFLSYRGELEDVIVVAHPGVVAHDGMRLDDTTITDHDLIFDDRKSADFNVFAYFSIRVDDGTFVYHTDLVIQNFIGEGNVCCRT